MCVSGVKWSIFQLLDLGKNNWAEGVLAQMKTMVSKCWSLPNNSVLAEQCFTVLIVTIKQDPQEQHQNLKVWKDLNPSVSGQKVTLYLSSGTFLLLFLPFWNSPSGNHGNHGIGQQVFNLQNLSFTYADIQSSSRLQDRRKPHSSLRERHCHLERNPIFLNQEESNI